MSPFLGTHQTKLDGKQRTSVPAQFRSALRTYGSIGLILRPSHKHPCIEAWPVETFDRVAQPLQTLDLFSEDQDDWQFALYADAHPVEPDKDGRVILPEPLVQYAGLTDALVFIGLGRLFQIWEPAAAAARVAAAKDSTRSKKLTLPPAQAVPA